MIALGVAPLDLGLRRVVGQQLGVDVELADPPGDELGELAAEVQDHHRVRLTGRCAAGDAGPGSILGRALRAGRLEGGLEVGLDLGVVGGQDPVAGVGDLAVDGLAPVWLRRRWRLRGSVPSPCLRSLSTAASALCRPLEG